MKDKPKQTYFSHILNFFVRYISEFNLELNKNKKICSSNKSKKISCYSNVVAFAFFLLQAF